MVKVWRGTAEAWGGMTHLERIAWDAVIVPDGRAWAVDYKNPRGSLGEWSVSELEGLLVVWDEMRGQWPRLPGGCGTCAFGFGVPRGERCVGCYYDGVFHGWVPKDCLLVTDERRGR